MSNHQHVWVLAVPYNERGVASANGARWDSINKQTVFVGDTLPLGLTPYASADCSWERWVEDDLNNDIKPLASPAGTFTARVHQKKAAKMIAYAAHKGARGFLLADDVGVGKTISAWEGVKLISKIRPTKNVLIVCPLAVVPHWRRTIVDMGAGNLRVCVINYDRLKKLLSIPETAKKAKRTRTKNKRVAAQGESLVDWDIVIFDESHKCFPYNTLVETREGMKKIGEIVEDKLPVEVLSWNPDYGWRFKPVTDYHVSPAPTQMVEFTHVLGSFSCTVDHPVWTDELGYIPAIEIVERLQHSEELTLLTVPRESQPEHNYETTSKNFIINTSECQGGWRSRIISAQVVMMTEENIIDKFVYNIGVADNDNYAANDVLVHNCKNQSQRTQAAARIAGYHRPRTDNPPFVLWMSATAGQNPVELSYLSPLLAQLTRSRSGALKDFGPWLQEQGFHVVEEPRWKKWSWTENPQERAKDIERMRKMMFSRTTPVALRRLPTDIAGWPEMNRVLFPVELEPSSLRLYEGAWTQFRHDMELVAKGKNPTGGMVARLRFRQKASLLRVPGTVGHINDLLDNDLQVAVSCQFLESLDAIKEELEKSGIKVSVMDGRDPAGRENERLKFQKGITTVVLFTPVEGFSLHQEELLSDGSLASSAPRALVIHDPRYSGIEALQIEGRTHRDGKSATAYYMFSENTVEEDIVKTLFDRLSSTKALVGDDVSLIEELTLLLDQAKRGVKNLLS